MPHQTVVTYMRSIFAQHEITEVALSGNGP